MPVIPACWRVLKMTLCALGVACLPGPAAAQAPQAPAEGGPRFDILEFVVVGDTLLGAAAIERAVYPFLGPGRTAGDAEDARKALERAYQAAGYLSIAVTLPQQRVDAGEVRLEVTQATVDRLSVTGAKFHLPSRIREALPSLAPGNVPNFNEMQAELGLLARASADREITPLLSAGERPGTLAVELKVQDELALHGSTEINDKQSVGTETGRFEAGLSYGNLFQRGHSLGLNWFYSPRQPKQANILSATYQFPLGGPGDRLVLSATNSDSDTPTTLGGATVSRGKTVRLLWRDELPEREGLNHALSWGLTYHDLNDRNQDVAGFTLETPHLRYVTAQAAYDWNWAGAGGVAGRQSSLRAELTVSLPGMNRRTVDCSGVEREQFACKREAAGPGFQVLGLTLSHREPLGRWALVTRMQAQIADAPLVPSEQVAYGGEDSVRGYHDGELSADLGMALRFELQTPQAQWRERWTLGAFGFFDAAGLRRLYALSTEPANQSMASAGAGLRLGAPRGFEAGLSWARALRATSRQTNGLRETLTEAGARWSFFLRHSF